MIRVDRGTEPDSVARQRRARLPTAIAVFEKHGGGSPELAAACANGYQIARDTLHERQHRKCAYCERRHGRSASPVEHFRPKAKALRGTRIQPAGEDLERYWWLTWTWANLFSACGECNCPRYKGNWFPLEPGSPPLPLLSLDLANERACLIDPAVDDPLDHMRWVPVDRSQTPRAWTWTLKPLTPRGVVTLIVLGLERLADDVTDAYRTNVWPRFGREVVSPDEPRVAQRAWSDLIAELVSPQAEFAAAKWAMFDMLRDCNARVRRLGLPPPERP